MKNILHPDQWHKTIGKFPILFIAVADSRNDIYGMSLLVRGQSGIVLSKEVRRPIVKPDMVVLKMIDKFRKLGGSAIFLR